MSMALAIRNGEGCEDAGFPEESGSWQRVGADSKSLRGS